MMEYLLPLMGSRSQETPVRQVVELYLRGEWEQAYFDKAVQVTVSPEGEVSSCEDKAKIIGGRSDGSSSEEVKELMVEDSMGSAVVTYATAEKIWTACLVMLRTSTGPTSSQWKIISEARTWTPRGSVDEVLQATKTTSLDVAGAAHGANFYCSSNRAADGAAMARVFTELSRLTFADDKGDLVVISATDFCDMVRNRWASPKHAPYAHLKSDPRVAKADALQSISIAAPRLALVKLRVAFPPVCYTDFLTFAKFSHGDPQWRIVAKSSVHVPFLADNDTPSS